MQNRKRNLIITTTLHREGRASAIAVLSGVGSVILIYLLGFIFHPDLTSLLVSLRGVPSIITPILTFVLAFYFLITPYSDFKWAIQNGISRKTFWQGRMIAMVILVVLVWFIGVILGLLDLPAFLMAGNLFWKSILTSLLAYFSVTLTMMAIGNGFALLNRTWKWLVGIGGPVVFFIAIFYFFDFAANFGFVSLMDSNFFVKMLTSAVTWWVVLAVYLLIMLVLTKVFANRMQLRRD